MNLDFGAVQALASRSRIHILRELLAEGRTPSELSDIMGKDTSQIVMELETLSNADLVEQHTEDTGFNTVYRPTPKARKIVANGSDKVEFSVGSSVLAGFVGLAAVTSRFLNPFSTSSTMAGDIEEPRVGDYAGAADAVEGATINSTTNASINGTTNATTGGTTEQAAAAAATSDGLLQAVDPIMIGGAILVLGAAVLLAYAWTIDHLSSGAAD